MAIGARFIVKTAGTLLLLLLLSAEASSFTSEVYQTTLSNGLRVILLEDHRLPVTTFQLWYRVGSRNEPRGKTGLSHLLEHMMFKGTWQTGPGEFSKTIKQLGGWENAFTSRDYTAYHATLATDHLEKVMALEADRMQNLKLDPQEFLSERKVVLEERRMRIEDDPWASLFEETIAAAFKMHPYRSPVIGWMDDIDKLSRVDLQRHYQAYYAPNNAVLVAVGDFNQNRLIHTLRKHFEDIPARLTGGNPPSEEPPQQGERQLRLKRTAKLPLVILAYHAPNQENEDNFAMEVLGNILFGGKSSRLSQKIVYQKQLAFEAGGEYFRLARDPFIFYLYAAAVPGKTAADLEKALVAEIDLVRTQGPTERELMKAKKQIEFAFLSGQDSARHKARLLGEYASVSDLKLLDEYLARIKQVTRQDVIRASRKYLSGDNRTVGILVPEGKTR